MAHIDISDCMLTEESPTVWTTQGTHTSTVGFWQQFVTWLDEYANGVWKVPPNPAQYQIQSGPLACGEVWYKWKTNIEPSYAGEWLNLNDPDQILALADILPLNPNQWNARQIASLTSADGIFDCYYRQCAEEPDGCCDCVQSGFEDSLLSSALYIALVIAIVVERIEYNKKKRGLLNNHAEAVGLVGAVGLLIVMNGPKPGHVYIALIAFIGMSFISARQDKYFALTRPDFTASENPRLTLR